MKERSQTKTTVAKIAKQAGVSKATVDRVMNSRGGVQEHTRHHVLSVVQRLKGDAPNPPISPVENVELEFIIPDFRNPYLTRQTQNIENYSRSIEGVSTKIHHLESAEEEVVLEAISTVSNTCQGIGIVGVDTARTRQALRGWTGRGIPVVTLASDIRQIGSHTYIGVDNYAAGRLAGHLVGKLISVPHAKAAIILGLRAYFGHEEREMGFRSVVRDQFPDIQIVAEHEVAEDDIRARDTLLDLLKVHPDLDGIYCIGSGLDGIIEALRITGSTQKILVVGHGLTDSTRRYLIDGSVDVIIEQNAEEETQAAVDHLVAAARGEMLPAIPPFAIQAIFRENIPL